MGSSKACISHKFDYLVNIIYVLSSLVAVITENDSLPNWTLNEVIHEEQHDPEQIKCLAYELLALFKRKKVFKGILHEHTCLNFTDKVHQSRVISVYS